MIFNEQLTKIKTGLNDKIDTLRNNSITATTIGSGHFNSKLQTSDLKSLIGSHKKAEEVKLRSLSTGFNSITEHFNDGKK